MNSLRAGGGKAIDKVSSQTEQTVFVPSLQVRKIVELVGKTIAAPPLDGGAVKRESQSVDQEGGRAGSDAEQSGIFGTERLLCFGADEGARSLGLESWPEIEIDLGHRSLDGVAPADVHDALVAGCGADVVL